METTPRPEIQGLPKATGFQECRNSTQLSSVNTECRRKKDAAMGNGTLGLECDAHFGQKDGLGKRLARLINVGLVKQSTKRKANRY